MIVRRGLLVAIMTLGMVTARVRYSSAQNSEDKNKQQENDERHEGKKSAEVHNHRRSGENKDGAREHESREHDSREGDSRKEANNYHPEGKKSQDSAEGISDQPKGRTIPESTTQRSMIPRRTTRKRKSTIRG